MASALDPQIVEYLERMAEAGAPPVGTVSPAELRANFAAAAAGVFGPVDPVASVEDRRLPGGVPVRIYRPRETDELSPAFVYLHGGGWVIGSLDTHDGIVRALANRSGYVAVSVDYRLAPEHPFPAGLDDGRAATEWVLGASSELGIDPSRIAVAGDSSGATLAAVLARSEPVALQVLICPVTDHRFDTGSYEQFAEGYGLTRDAMRWYWAQYLGRADGSDPDASPLRAPDLANVPPAVVVVAECDPLRDEALAYAARLEGAAVPVSLLRYEGMIHGFIRLAATVDRASEALDDLGRELAARL